MKSSRNQTEEPSWYCNLKEHYVKSWRGQVKQADKEDIHTDTEDIRMLLEKSQDQPDFVPYLMKFKKFIESPIQK